MSKERGCLRVVLGSGGDVFGCVYYSKLVLTRLRKIATILRSIYNRCQDNAEVPRQCQDMPRQCQDNAEAPRQCQDMPRDKTNEILLKKEITPNMENTKKGITKKGNLLKKEIQL